jgi:diguanylate cyclase (GGDEF)-like protein
MNDVTTSETGMPMALPVFVLSFRHRDELAASVARHGWHPIAARRIEGVEARFIASGARIIVIDARGAFYDGLEAVRTLSETAEANMAALIVLVSRTDVAKLDEIFAAGATHYLASPFGDEELRQALRFAERHVDRVAGGGIAAPHRAALAKDGHLSWQADLGIGTVRLSPALADLLGLPTVVQGARAIINCIAPGDRRAAIGAYRRVQQSRQATAFVHMFKANPQFRHVEHLVYDAASHSIFGTAEALKGDANDDQSSARDPLTGLSNATEARHWLRDSSGACLVLLVALDRFESINTTYGRSTGDAILQAIGRRIAPLARDMGGRTALIGRMAGAEFIVGISGDVSYERASLLAQGLADACQKPFALDDSTLSLEASIGGVMLPAGEANDTTILRRASAALAEAKTSEDARRRILTQADADRAAHNRDLQDDLRRALDRNEIELLFQPQVDIVTNRIVGVEALARWQHPVHGKLGAVTLFSVAEDSGFVAPLSAHVQRRAIEIAAQWPAILADLRLSINVTADDMEQDGFVERFLRDVDAVAFARDRLTLELTESGLMEDLANAAALLADFRAAGCRVAIDDFGTGYSSLAYLKALPLDYLKIDKGLAEDISGSARDRVVVRGVIDMARSLGLDVIAEGVETEAQLGLLAREGCTYYQGYLCSEAVNSADLEALVSRWNAEAPT